MQVTPKILVTGGTGLVGSHLLAKLVQKNHSVRAVYRKSSNLDAVKNVFSYYTDDFENAFKKIEWVEADILDIPALENVFSGIEQVYHCAAVVSFRKKDWRLMKKVNIEGTANMVNIALVNKVQKFCYVSSIASLNKKEGETVIDETHEWNPEADNYEYAISKHGGEMEVWRASQEGLPVVIVQPGVILGAGFWNTNTGNFFTNASKGFKYYTLGKTGFVSVEDVVNAMLHLMQSNIQGEAYILVAENATFQKVMTSIAKALNTKPPTTEVTPFIASVAWRLAWLQAFISGKQPFITKHSALAALKEYSYSSDKIKKDLNFSFKSLEQSIDAISRLFLKDKAKM